MGWEDVIKRESGHKGQWPTVIWLENGTKLYFNGHPLNEPPDYSTNTDLASYKTPNTGKWRTTILEFDLETAKSLAEFKEDKTDYKRYDPRS